MDCLVAGAGHGFFLCQKWKQPLPADFSKSRSSSIALNLHVNKGSHTAAAEASLNRRLHERSRKLNERDGASITNASDEEQVPPSSHFLASEDVDFRRRSSNLNKASEDQVLPPSSKNVDLNSTNLSQNVTASFEKLTSDNPNDINVTSISKPTISKPSETEGASIAKLTSSSPKKFGTPFVAKLTNSNPKENDRVYIEKVTSDDTIGNGRASIARSCKDPVTLSSQLLATKKVELPSNSNDQNERISATAPPSVSEDDIAPSCGLPAELHSYNPGKSGRMSISASPSFPDHKVSLSHLLASKNVIEFISRFPAWADAQKESGMPQRQKRAFYSHNDWLQHRSSLRYVRHMLSSFSSRVIVSLIPPVFTFTAGSMVVATYNTAVNFGFFPTFFPLLHAASLPYELTAPALALLLVFRTDASYSRYDEARKTWTSVISTTKDFARHSAKLIKGLEDVALKSSLLTYIMAFPVSLKCHLIHGSDMRKDLQVLLEDDDLEFVLASRHRPNCIIQLMSQTLGLVQLENTERVLLEGHITQYNASVSVCERLIRTPIPLSYTRLTSRFLVLWHMSLPIVLWDSCNWLVVPATFFSAATLFCIEEVGVLIEEPFPMLALDKIIGIAHDNIRELMELQQQADEFLTRKRKLSSDGSAYGAGTKGSSLKSKQ